jgi:hypothetical protein
LQALLLGTVLERAFHVKSADWRSMKKAHFL